MKNRYTKPQKQYDDLIADFDRNGGEVHQIQPALAKGSEATRDLKRHVAKRRAEFRKEKRNG